MNIKRLSRRDVSLFILLSSILAALLAILWKFGFEESLDPYLPGVHDVDSVAERWEFVVVTTLMSALALVFPAIVIRRLIEERFQHNQKAAEALLDASEQKYRSLFETARVCILVFDTDGRFVMLNQQSASVLGGAPDDFVGRSLREKFPNAADFHLQRFRQILREGKGANYDDAMTLADGIHWYSSSMEPLFDPAGKISGIQVVAIDITERKASEQALLAAKAEAERSNNAKSRFLAAASHDLRQPLQSITLLSQTLAGTPLDESQQEIFSNLAVSLQSMTDLLEALLDISRFDTGSVKSYLAPVLANELFDRIGAEFLPVASAKSLRLEVHCPNRHLLLMTDEKLLRSLLRNLVGNAIKYTERGGILIGIRRRGNLALIQVWDSGIGIAPEHIGIIFEEYFQVGNPERDRTKGLGLGLAIARRVARLLTADLVCHSRLGHGTVFEFSLPLAASGSPEPPARPQALANQPRPQLDPAIQRIALIEDEAMLARAIQMTLESPQTRVTIYLSGEAALADPELLSADFFISDYRLPGINGVHLLDTIQVRSSHTIKALLLTGDVQVDQRNRPEILKWLVLNKPIDHADLFAAIAALSGIGRPPKDADEAPMPGGQSGDLRFARPQAGGRAPAKRRSSAPSP